jgi:hypothetical protein
MELKTELKMINESSVKPFILLAATTPAIGNDFIQYGFLGILLSLLIWYSRKSYIANEKREKEAKEDRKETTERYEKLIETITEQNNQLVNRMEDRHGQEVTTERDRYHELHLELLAMYKAQTNQTQ